MTERERSDPRAAGDLADLSAAEALRKRAEEEARSGAGQIPESLDALSPEAFRQLLHELRVHQIELEMQNEELRRAQLALETSRARYFDLYDLAPVGYLTTSSKGTILEANLTSANLLGIARSGLVKQPLSRFVFRDDQDVYYRHRKRLLESDEPQVSELRLVREQGNLFWARMEAITAQDDGGATICRVVISDVTERKEAEAERERLLIAEQEARAVAERAVREREDFLSIASHELKTPITSLMGFSQVIIRKLGRDGGLDPDEVTRSLTRINRQSRKLNDLVRQLLDVSRIESGKLPLAMEDASASTVLEEALDLVREIHPDRTFLVDNTAPVRAYIDPPRIEQVIVNLLDNAVKFSPTGTPIEVGISRDAGGRLVISVRDHGDGIPAKDRQKVFERFHQNSPGKYSVGMGLGLYISAQIVGLHGGTITCEAPDDGGSRFVVRLPLGTSSPDPAL